MSNRTEGMRRKLSHTPTGRLKPLRLFSTLLPPFHALTQCGYSGALCAWPPHELAGAGCKSVRLGAFSSALLWCGNPRI